MDHTEYLRRMRDGLVREELPFPPEEYAGRVARVRQDLAAEGLEGLIVCTPGNLNYLAGYYTPSITNFTALVLPLEGEPSVLTASSEVPAVICTGWVDDVTTFPWNGNDRIGSLLTTLLKASGLEKKRIGIELDRGGFIHRVRNELAAALPGATLEDGSGIVQRTRLIKSARELELMRRAGEITSRGVDASLRAVRAGITDSDVARAGYDALVAAGSEFLAVNPICNSGRRSSWHHATFKRVPLAPGDTVFLEYGGNYHRYHAPMMRTAVVGPPSDEVTRMAVAVKETLSLLLEGARAGRTAHEVARDARRGYAGLEQEMWFMGLCGYSVGIGFPPTWADAPSFIAEGIHTPLQAGMTFHLPIMFRVPWKFGVGLSETIAITETGCEILTEKTRDLHVALPE